MQRVIFDYRARKVTVGNPAFASAYSEVLAHQHLIDNAIEVSSGDITLSASINPSTFTATNSQYLQLISATPFYISSTLSSVTSQVNATSLFSYFNKTAPLDSIQLHNGSAIYDSVSGVFTIDAGTKPQIVTYLLLKF